MSKQSLKLNQKKEIPKGWEIVQIGDHFNFKNGLNKAKKFFGQGTPIINYMDVYPYSAIWKKNIHGKVTLSNDELRAFEIRKGDVLFTRTSETIEEIGLSSTVIDDVKKTVFSGFLLRARPITELFELEFKKYCFRSKNVRRQIISTSSQTTRALTNGRFLSKVSILIPKNPQEQFAIAESISNIEKLIENIQTTIEKKKNIKQGAMQKLLTGKRRLGEFNKKWISKELDEICLKIGDGIHTTPNYAHNTNIFFINGNNLVNDTIKISENTKCVNKLELKKHGKDFEENTILMSINGTIGNLALYKNEKVILGKSIAYIQLEKLFENKFIFYLLQMPIVKNFYENELTGTTIRNLSLKSIRNTPIAFPEDPKEQIAIANILSDMDSDIQELETKREKYIMIKNGMMQKLLTGEIRLT